MNNLGNRLKLYCQEKNLKNKDLVPILGMTEQKIGTILNGRYQGSFKEFEEIVSKISDNTDDEYYYSTGKHLQHDKQQPTTADYQSKMLDQMTQLNQMMSLMVDKITELSQKIEDLENNAHIESHTQEVKKSGMKRRVHEHVPDH